MFYTVFSTDMSPKMQWQSDLLEYSWKKVDQEGVLIRLIATDDPANLPAQQYAHCVATTPWNVHPDTGDSYPIYNKPASLLEWVFREGPEGTVLILDPDCVFRAPVTRRVSPGSPISQRWVDFRIGRPSARSPFGLGEGFSFLKDHCTRVDKAVAAVMIPTLIHTSDLRKLCARWLQLCGVVRDNYCHAEGEKVWEADMFAYLAACAEYGIDHETASLGICTNWNPADVPDAPIIHYCQPILSTDGGEIFYKHTYKPWAFVDTNAEPRQAYGRDMIALVNDYVRDVAGIRQTPTPATRPTWRNGVMEGRVLDEILLEIPDECSSLWLNASGKAIWELCDGSRRIEEIGSILSDRFAIGKDAIMPDIIATVERLHEVRFVDLH